MTISLLCPMILGLLLPGGYAISPIRPADPVTACQSSLQGSQPGGKRPQRTETWVYSSVTDGTGEGTPKASLASPDRLRVGFPGNGTATVVLTLRRTANGTTLYLQASQGQFTGSFQGGSARIRFDEQPWKTYAYSPAANGTGTIIFFDAVTPLIARLKSSRQMTIEVAFNGQGRQHVSFPVAGLRWTP